MSMLSYLITSSNIENIIASAYVDVIEDLEAIDCPFSQPQFQSIRLCFDGAFELLGDMRDKLSESCSREISISSSIY
jgi:hypothetical protein